MRPPLLTPYRRNLIAVVVTMAGATFSYGFTFPLLSLLLEQRGVDSTVIGINTAMEAVMVFAVAPFAPLLFRRYSASTLMLFAVGTRLALFLLLPVLPGLAAWFVLRALMGAAGSLMWMVSEAWINEVVGEHTRGRVLSLYSMATAAGFAAGPLALAATGTDGWLPFAVGAAVLLGAGLTVLLAAGHVPSLAGDASAPLVAFLRLAPLAMLCCFATSALDTTLVAFLPLYAGGIGADETRALYLLTIMGAGGILLVYPFGWLADRINRATLTLAVVVMLIAGTLSIPAAMRFPPTDLLLFFAVGGLLGALYTMANVHMGERFRGADLAAASTMFAVMWGVGALLGPPVGGLGLDLLPRYGLPLALVAMVAVALPVALRRALRKPPDGAAARSITEP